MNIKICKILGVLILFFVAIFYCNRQACAASPIISEKYIVIFDLSGTFVKDPENIKNSIEKIRSFAENTEAKRAQFAKDAANEMKGRRASNPEVNVEFTIIGMGSYPEVIWSGNIANFLELVKEKEIYHLVQKTVQDAKSGSIRNNNRCTDIKGALDIGLRRLKSKKPDRELIVRSGVIIFSDLLNDPPDSGGRCSNRNDPNPPEGEIWDALFDYLENNKDRANNPPAFYPNFSFIALGMTEQANKSKDPATLWAEKLVSIQQESHPFELEFLSFADAVNYSIPVPARITAAEIYSYMDNFDVINGTRVRETPSTKGGSDFFKIFLAIVGIAALVFFVIILLIAGIVIFFLVRKRRRGQQRT